MPEALRPETINAVKRGSKFAHQDDGNHLAGLSSLAVLLERLAHLQGHHRAAEEAGHGRDPQAADADGIHLDQDIVPVVRFAEDVPQGAAEQKIEFLNRCYRTFKEVEQTSILTCLAGRG